MRRKVKLAVFFLTVTLAAAPDVVSPAVDLRRALAAISGNSLSGNLSFLASSLLEGRDTPSRGLDLAGEYIAAQFRRAGLKPAGDDGYFQTARMLLAAPAPEGFDLRISSNSRSVTVPKDELTVVSGQALDLSGVPVYKIGHAADLKAAAVKGKVVELDELPENTHSLAAAAAALQPAAFLEADDDDSRPVARRLIDPDEERAVYGDVPRLIVRNRDVVTMLADAKPRETGIRITIKLSKPDPGYVTVRNVAAVLRGSDPALRDQYVLLTAHYDHLGRNAAGQLFPGANDDGSGTVSVIEIARALSSLRIHPKRSIVFALFFGEEEGSLGSRYYTSHPLFPLSKTVVDLNLEQVGRTDSNAGPKISNATLTGFRYSSVAGTLEAAGGVTGIKVYETPNSDRFFDRSDNLPFAEHGIPAHTLAVAFEFPDYHQPGDIWQKIDYANMAKVDRMITLGIIMLADSPTAPRWNTDNPNAARYAKER